VHIDADAPILEVLHDDDIKTCRTDKMCKRMFLTKAKTNLKKIYFGDRKRLKPYLTQSLATRPLLQMKKYFLQASELNYAILYTSNTHQTKISRFPLEIFFPKIFFFGYWIQPVNRFEMESPDVIF